MRVDSLFRYPIKGLSPERLESVQVAAGEGFPLDRMYALLRTDAAFDPARPSPATSSAPWRIFNIGNHEPVGLLDFIAALERALGRKTKMNMLPMQPGDVPATYADTMLLRDWVGFAPATPLSEGIARFAAWFKEFGNTYGRAP